MESINFLYKTPADIAIVAKQFLYSDQNKSV